MYMDMVNKKSQNELRFCIQFFLSREKPFYFVVLFHFHHNLVYYNKNYYVKQHTAMVQDSKVLGIIQE